MRWCIPLLALALAACGDLDTSPGASGFPDTAIGSTGRYVGQITTGGQMILNRELVPNSPRAVR